MRGIIVTIAALATSATLYTAVPAAAQSVGIRAGDSGVAVRIGEEGRYRHRDRGHHYGWYRGQHRGWSGAQAGCREVTTRTRRSDGTVVISKRSTC